MIRKLSEHWAVRHDPESAFATELIYDAGEDGLAYDDREERYCYIPAADVAELIEALQGSGFVWRREPQYDEID